jgi:hypothetical protein
MGVLTRNRQSVSNFLINQTGQVAGGSREAGCRSCGYSIITPTLATTRVRL